MKILIAGAAGMLGRDAQSAGERGGHELVPVDLPELDITDAGAVEAFLREQQPEAVLNCAAWTDVDGAETHREQAYAVNAAGAGNLARAAAAVEIPMLHISTDYVFDGRAPLDAEGRRRAYLESDPTGPSSVYGQSKLAGEQQVLAASPRHAVVRTAWLYGVHGRNFVDTMLRLAGEREAVQVVDDQIGSPTWSGHLAPAVLGLLERGVSGLVHHTGAGAISWNGFAQEIFRQSRAPLPRGGGQQRADGTSGAASGVVGARERACRGVADAGLARGPGGVLGGKSWDDARMRLLVCGGAGFIGSHFARVRVHEHGDEVAVLDKLTYAGREENLRDIADAAGFRFIRGGIEDPQAVAEALDNAADGQRPEAIVNFAAETHVDRSIAEPDAFVRTHALGTYVLLEAARERGLRYLQVSTDEVYGSIEVGTFTEASPLRPSSPYSATKTGADLLVQSYFHTYGLQASICRGSNNYGSHQYPEKLIPLMILNALHGDPAAGVWGRQAGAQLDPRQRLRAGDRLRAGAGRAGRGLQRGWPRRARQHRRGATHPHADRRG